MLLIITVFNLLRPSTKNLIFAYYKCYKVHKADNTKILAIFAFVILLNSLVAKSHKSCDLFINRL